MTKFRESRASIFSLLLLSAESWIPNAMHCTENWKTCQLNRQGHGGWTWMCMWMWRRLIVQRQRPGRIGDHHVGLCGMRLGVSVFLSPPLNTNKSTQAQVGHDWGTNHGPDNGWNGKTGQRTAVPPFGATSKAKAAYKWKLGFWLRIEIDFVVFGKQCETANDSVSVCKRECIHLLLWCSMDNIAYTRFVRLLIDWE